MSFKICRQCGELKPINDYRKYYGGRAGTYTICKRCERINSRAKYLERKGDTISPDEASELEKIYALYAAQEEQGLRPPRKTSGLRTSVESDVDALLSNYDDRRKVAQEVADTDMVLPDKLLHWLQAPLDADPDYYIDDIYDALQAEFRPALCLDEHYMPVYDDTYTDVLNKILARFNKYEDEYYDD